MSDFLEFVKQIQIHGFDKLIFDVVTIKSIICPVYGVPTHPVDGVFVGLNQTLAKEFNVIIRSFILDKLSYDNIVSMLSGGFSAPIGHPIVISEDNYWFSKIEPVQLKESKQQCRAAFHHYGSYVIIGANGGLGGLLARYLAENYQAKLILIGRSDENPKLVSELKELGASSVVYSKTNIENFDELNDILNKCGHINGVVHSALLLHDSLIVNLSKENLLKVLKPKVHGTINLINSLKNLKTNQPDFVLFFSSIQSYIANPGQANYTAACVAKDALASMLSEIHMINTKIINWGYWGRIGIVASDNYRQRMEKLGIGSIEEQEGISIIEHFLSSDLNQITVIKASHDALERLNIEPNRNLSNNEENTSMNFSNKSSGNDGNYEFIIPDYDLSNPEISKNELAINELDAYVCKRINETNIPDNVASRFSRLLSALNKIPSKKSLTYEELKKQFPQIVGHINLIENCLKNYSEILSGKLASTEVLFPNGTFDLVEAVYCNNPIADYFNKIVAEIVKNYICKFNNKKKMKILEIGGGTGGTTRFVIPSIESFDVHYTFTDVSFAFLKKSQKKFSNHKFIDYKILDISSKNKIAEKFDVIIATNVIHATPNLKTTLDNVHELLNDGGIFVLNEITAIQNFATAVFGLTDGWWLYQDDYRIENSPLVDGEKWRELLKKSNLHTLGVHGNNQQQIIVSTPLNGYKQFNASENNETKQGQSDNSKIKNYIKNVVSEVMMTLVDEIDDDTPFQEYGIDSIISLELIKPFKEVYGYLPATLLFEYPTVSKLANYLVENFGSSKVELSDSEYKADVAVKTEMPRLVNHIKIRDYIKKIISEVMMMSIEEIDDDTPFQEYGIDSIISLELTKPFKEVYGYLPATLLFEHSTVNELTKYLAENFSDSNFKTLEIVNELVNDAVRTQTSQSLNIEHNETKLGPVDCSKIKDYIKKVISDVMMMSIEEIDDDTPFQEYGIDSIISLELMKPFKEVYGYLPATLLFEYPTVNELANYLVESFSDSQIKLSETSSIVLPSSEGTTHNELRNKFRNDDIAIIGMAGRFPNSETLDEYEDNLLFGKDCTSTIPKSRWDKKNFIKENSPIDGGSYTEIGAFIEEVYAFDNDFFNITPNESKKMDPQERIFLQNAFHLIQNAGYSLSDLKGTNTGVYVGVMNSTYHWHTRKNNNDPMPTSLKWSIANRVSYFFDFHGPSMAIDTACSSSLSALHLACQALKTNDCRQAIVGGVNLILHPRQYELLCGMHMLSKTGKCRPFGGGADGFVDGEGVGSVFLKKYEDAVKDNDRIYAVILGSSVNAGGKSNGYTAPNAKAQGELVTKTLSKANIQPSEVSYIETHGTGTELGDPIEIRGLSTAFSDVASSTIPIGSVKSNIGHLESAAGISSLIKVILQIKKNVIFPSINAEEENKHLNMDKTPFYVSKKAHPWDSKKHKIACISSFGAGGANAHAIVKEYQREEKTNSVAVDDYYFITVSHRNPAGLQKQLNCLHNWLSNNYVDMYGLAFTLNCTRDHFSCRRIFVVKNQSEFLKLISLDLSDHQQNHASTISDVDISTLVINGYKASEIVEQYLQGINVSWNKLYPKKTIINVPNYQFTKRIFQIDTVESPLIIDESEIIEEHNINGAHLVPATWIISALHQKFTPLSGIKITDLQWL